MGIVRFGPSNAEEAKMFPWAKKNFCSGLHGNPSSPPPALEGRPAAIAILQVSSDDTCASLPFRLLSSLPFPSSRLGLFLP